MISRKAKYLLLLTVLCLVMMLYHFTDVGLRAEGRPLIASLSNQHSENYLQVLEGFERQILKKIPDAKFMRYLLPQHSSSQSNILAEINQQQPALLFTLGSRATDIGLNSIPDIPIVASMIINEKILHQSNRATGVLLKYPPEVHLQLLHQLLPNVDRIAIVYNPQENSTLLTDIEKVATKLHIEIDPMPVATIKQLPAALKSLERNADMLLGIHDQTVYSNQTAKAILLFSFRNRIPFAGLSSTWVKAGALYALTWDYLDIGKQCGLIATEIFNGTPVLEIPPETPKKRCYEINLRTAKHLRLTIDLDIIQGATKVYR